MANFEALPMALALDYARLGMAAAITSPAERVVKLLQRSHSGLPSGLRHVAGPEPALEVFAHTAVALAGEARLLAAPVSNELPSSSLEDGIEDRMTFAPLAARRLAEQTALGLRIAALELVCARRGDRAPPCPRAGHRSARCRGTAAHALLRRHVPPVGRLGEIPVSLDSLLADLTAGALA